MKHTQLKKVIDSIIDIADAKKAEDLRAYFVAEKNWMTEFVVVIGVLNKIQSKSKGLTNSNKIDQNLRVYPYKF